MLSWLKGVLGRTQVEVSEINEPARNELAREELNRLRREELSLGAQLRQGVPVKSFPGLTSGSVPKVDSAAPFMQARVHSQNAQSTRSDGDFTTSMVVGAATGSAHAGYAVGGSLVGAIAGSSIHQPLSSNFDSASESNSFDSSSTGGCDN